MEVRIYDPKGRLTRKTLGLPKMMKFPDGRIAVGAVDLSSKSDVAALIFKDEAEFGEWMQKQFMVLKGQIETAHEVPEGYRDADAEE